MMTLEMVVSPDDPRLFLVQVTGPLKDRRGLNAVLAQRLSDELTDHFRTRDAEPNKQGWRKTHFWNQVGRATGVDQVTDDGAVVKVADARFRIQLFGGTIKPTGGRTYLTIPLVEEARGLNPASYEKKTGRDLFRIGHARLLFEKRQRGGTSSLLNATTGRRWHKGTAHEIGLKAKQQLRPVYALAKSVTIQADPNALPDRAKLVAALIEEGNDFLALAP